MARQSAAKGVPSGWQIRQNIFTTLPRLGRQGSTDNVEGMGKRNRSDSATPPKPVTAEASKEMPWEKARPSSWGMMEIFF